MTLSVNKTADSTPGRAFGLAIISSTRPNSKELFVKDMPGIALTDDPITSTCK